MDVTQCIRACVAKIRSIRCPTATYGIQNNEKSPQSPTPEWMSGKGSGRPDPML